MPVQIAPSLAAAPLDRLREVMQQLETASADLIHIDIEDGQFVPIMTLGTKIIRDLRPLSARPFDIHLMMVSPEWLLPGLAADGANRVTVHYEACPYPRRTLRQIAALGMTAGLAFNPATPLPDLTYLQPYLRIVNILTTEPEVPDSPFLPAVLEKVRQGRQQPGAAGIEWIVDGGINAENIDQACAAGADTVVAGRAAFANDTISANLARLRERAAG